MVRAQTVYAVGGYAIPDFASPDPIGSSTPNSGVFTTLAASGVATVGGITATGVMGFTPTGSVTWTYSGNSQRELKITNANAGASVAAGWSVSNGTKAALFGIDGTGSNWYGSGLGTGIGYIYTTNNTFAIIADGTGTIKFAAGGTTEVAEIKSTGLEVVGRIAAGSSAVTDYEAAYGSAGNKSLFSASNTAGEASQALAQFTDAANASSINFVKGRGTAAAGTIVQSGDPLGGIYWYGTASASALGLAASITASVDGTPGAAADMPGRLVFSVSPDGSATAAEVLRLSNDKTAKFAGTVKSTAGTGTAEPVMVGTLSVNTTAVGNVGAGTDDLMTYPLPANSLSANNKGIRATVWGTVTNNANAKAATFNFGATSISFALRANQDGAWRAEFVIMRTGSGAQILSGRFQGGLVNGGVTDHLTFAATPAETDTGAITVKCTGTGVADNDIVQKGMIVEFIS